jgi:hypothetical protein
VGSTRPRPLCTTAQPQARRSPSGPSGARAAGGRGLCGQRRRRLPLGVRARDALSRAPIKAASNRAHTSPSAAPASQPCAAACWSTEPERRRRPVRPVADSPVGGIPGTNRPHQELQPVETYRFRRFPTLEDPWSLAVAVRSGRRPSLPSPAILPSFSAAGEGPCLIPSVSSSFFPRRPSSLRPWSPAPPPHQSRRPLFASLSRGGRRGRPFCT